MILTIGLIPAPTIFRRTLDAFLPPLGYVLYSASAVLLVTVLLVVGLSRQSWKTAVGLHLLLVLTLGALAVLLAGS